jgi:hypothetical protein
MTMEKERVLRVIQHRAARVADDSGSLVAFGWPAATVGRRLLQLRYEVAV